MRLDKFTLRGQEAIQAGIELAERNQNQQVEPEHLLCAMLEQSEGIVRPLLGKLGANVQVVKNDCEAAVGRFPRVQGGQQYFSPRLSKVFTAAEKRAEKMQDEYISTEHLLLAIVDELESAEAHMKGSRDVILGVLDHVMAFTITHFIMEEQLMADVNYPSPACDEMILQHREFTAYARLRVLEFRKGELISVLPLQAFLAEWLTIHEFGLDKLLADFIRERAAAQGM
jgi:ATP-dependent Clp protease ATP-binding subunit ClpA